MEIQQAIELAKRDIENNHEWREFEHPEHPSQIAYDMERWMYENKQAPEWKWSEICPA